MSEFFLELFSEEIPSSLQKNLREDLLNSFIKVFNEKSISFKKNSSYSNIEFFINEKLQKDNKLFVLHISKECSHWKRNLL